MAPGSQIIMFIATSTLLPLSVFSVPLSGGHLARARPSVATSDVATPVSHTWAANHHGISNRLRASRSTLSPGGIQGSINRAQETAKVKTVTTPGSAGSSRDMKLSSAVATPPAADTAVRRANAKVFGYDVTRFGAYFMAHALVYGFFWYMSLLKWLTISWITKDKFDADRHAMDRSSYLWAKRTLGATGCYPVVTGLENLPVEHGGTLDNEGKPVMIVANHASWMDVPVIRQITGKCKFLAKKDLGSIPILGTSLRWGHHPLVDRSDKRSTVKSFRQGVDWLKKGVSLVTFPEGTRSVDGRFSSPENLKGGAFKMAIYSGARVVPVSIVGTYDIMPKSALLPLRPSEGRIQIIIHPPIDTHKEMSEEDLALMTHKLIASGLPASQQPLP